jgi:hypothetical protein
MEDAYACTCLNAGTLMFLSVPPFPLGIAVYSPYMCCSVPFGSHSVTREFSRSRLSRDVVSNPVFNPPSGRALQVTMSAACARHLCYRADGIAPTCNRTDCGDGSIKYNDSVIVPPNVLRAVACDGYTTSATPVKTASFSLGLYAHDQFICREPDAHDDEFHASN